MLSKLTYRYFMIMATTNFLLVGGPVRWNFTTNRFVILKSKIFRLLSYMNFLILICYYGYLIYRLAEAALDEIVDIPSLFKRLFHCIGYGLGLKYQFNKSCHFFDIPVFMNSYIQLSEELERKYFPKDRNANENDNENENDQRIHKTPKSKHRKGDSFKNGSEKMLRLYLIMAILIATINVFETIAVPNSAHFISSMLQSPDELSLIEKLPYTIFQSFLLCSFWAMNLYFTYPVYSYMFSRTLILRKLILDRNQSRRMCKESSELDNPNFLHIYRSLQVEHSLFNNCFRYIYFPGHNLLQGSAAIICFYGMISMSGTMVANFSVLAAVYVGHFTVFFGTLSLFHELSGQAINSRKTEDPYWRRILRSCPPLKIYIGSYYYVGKVEVLSFWSVIVNNTITLLLSF